jgi:hypothetical protein
MVVGDEIAAIVFRIPRARVWPPVEHRFRAVSAAATSKGRLMRVLMRSAGSLTTVAAVLVAPVAFGAVAQAGVNSAATARWRVSFVSKNAVSDFTDIAAVSARDVWAVGNVTPPGLGGRHPIVRRWDGKAWRTVALPSKFSHAQLFAVAASSRTDVWVFGQWRNSNGLDGHAFALRWTGSWSVVGFFKTFNLISDGVVFGPKNAWIFGAAGVRHFNGHGWTTSSLPYSLGRASAISANDIWAVGADKSTSAPVLSRSHNGKWVLQPLPAISSGPPGPIATDVLARSDQDVWVVGGTLTGQGGLRPLSLHWQSGSWTQPVVHGVDHLGRVIADGKGGLWAAFIGPFDGSSLEHFTGGTWQTVKLPVVTGKATSAIALALVPGSATAYAAGSTIFGGLPGTNALLLKYSR